MTRTEHLLTILAEECAEVAQQVSKALRFGLATVQPKQEKTNAQRIMDEVNDFVAVYLMLSGGVMAQPETDELFRMSPRTVQAAIDAKQAKVETYLAFSAGRGLVDDMPAALVSHPEAK